MAEGVGFEPTVRKRTTVFETAPFDHSGTPPQGCQRNGGAEPNARILLPQAQRRHGVDKAAAGAIVAPSRNLAAPSGRRKLGCVMYAVIKTGGKQYRVAKNDVISVERLAGAAGDEVAFDEVLMVGSDDGATVGTPTVSGAKVTATVLEQARDDKIIVFKKKRRQGYLRRRGHRQAQTVLSIADISSGA